MNVRIFVGNLPFTVDEKRLNDEFSRFGKVESAKIVLDKRTGKSRGYGFVEFSDQAGGDEAIQKMAGQPLDGRPLTVNLAKTQQQ